MERDRRAELLDAAFLQFSRHGFRRTSMEDIAREASVSRPLLYQYFANKEDVFLALAQRLHEHVLDAVDAGLEGDTPVADRIAAAMVAKHAVMLETVPSEHRDEIFAVNSRLAGTLVHEANDRLHRSVAGALTAAERRGEIELGAPAAAIARVIVEGCHGIADAAAQGDTKGWRQRMELLVRRVVGPAVGARGTGGGVRGAGARSRVRRAGS